MADDNHYSRTARTSYKTSWDDLLDSPIAPATTPQKTTPPPERFDVEYGRTLGIYPTQPITDEPQTSPDSFFDVQTLESRDQTTSTPRLTTPKNSQSISSTKLDVFAAVNISQTANQTQPSASRRDDDLLAELTYQQNKTSQSSSVSTNHNKTTHDLINSELTSDQLLTQQPIAATAPRFRTDVADVKQPELPTSLTRQEQFADKKSLEVPPQPLTTQYPVDDKKAPVLQAAPTRRIEKDLDPDLMVRNIGALNLQQVVVHPQPEAPRAQLTVPSDQILTQRVDASSLTSQPKASELKPNTSSLTKVPSADTYQQLAKFKRVNVICL